MKRTALIIIAFVATIAHGQTDWREVSQLIENGSYSTAYRRAEAVYNNPRASSRAHLTAAYYMAQAAAYYQEDFVDSAEARYRRLLSGGRLDTIDRSLCYAFLGQYDSALAAEPLLKRTPVERIQEFCHSSKVPNMTPTVFDLLVVQMQDRGTLTPQQRVDWQRRLVAFHSSDADERVLLWHTARLLDMMDGVPNHPLVIDTVQHYLARHRASQCDLVTELYLRAAHLENDNDDKLAALRYCDSAISLFPKSHGGIVCANLKAELLSKEIDLQVSLLSVVPGQPSLQVVRYRNIDHLWLRIVKYDGIDNIYGDKARQRLSKAKAIEQWDIALPPDDSLNTRTACYAMPALKAGRYVLLASPESDFGQLGFIAAEVVCTDMLMATFDHGKGIITDRHTGQPIVGQEVRLEQHRYSNTATILDKTNTDANGRFGFARQEERWYTYLTAERDGVTVTTNNYVYSRWVADSNVHCEVRLDRPIYRPGDTLHIATIAYRTDGRNGSVAENCMLRFALHDPNGQEVATDSIPTDSYGVAATQFTLPTDRLPGEYLIFVRAGNRTVGIATARVEEYRQPRFAVSLDAASLQGTPAFGREYTVQGLAASYSAVPIGDARVHYTVKRQRLARWWWRQFGIADEVVVAEGETRTAADGSFSLAFIPLPDSNIDLSSKPSFQYIVSVDVNDINGESHEERLYLRVGFRNATLDYTDDCRILYRDLNGNDLPGTPEVRIDRLVATGGPLLSPRLNGLENGSVHYAIDTAEWHRLFPMLAYGKISYGPDQWAMQDANGGTLNGRPSGIYRVTISAPDADTLVVYRTITNEGERHVQERDCLLWADIDKATAEVGQRVRLRFGSPLDGTTIYYLLRVGGEERDFRRVAANGQLIQHIDIDIDSTMLGGLQIDLFTVRYGIEERWSRSISVPYSHKKLAVEIETFRDKLLPGEQEEWTIKVKNHEAKGEQGAVILSMYDDALNSYGPSMSWDFAPWHINHSNAMQIATQHLGTAYYLQGYQHKYYSGTYPEAWTLAEAMPKYARLGGIRMYKSAAARNAVVTTSLEVVEEEADGVEDMALAAPMAAQKEVAVDASGAEAGAGGAAEVHLRSNLNPLAFFAAGIRTDADGTATYRFSVPELLTRWNVRGLALTKDLKIGTLDRYLITQKQLMVQPNMPRFLRQGDSVVLMVKVMNISDEDRTVEVSLSLTNAENGAPLYRQVQQTCVAAQGSSQALFSIVVPKEVYVLTYEVVARTADGHPHLDLPTLSDGERGQIPVVSNRQAVTISRAMYINGRGEKRYTMPEWLDTATSIEPQLVAVEVVSNPAWLAVKTMPYMSSLENPSSIYLANQLYINRLGRDAMRMVDVSGWADLEDGMEGRLEVNEDVKQTALQATPWLRAAKSEAEQRRVVKAYFDTAKMVREHMEASHKLAERQNPDGGWGWMPESRSSVWATMQVLKRIQAEADGPNAQAALRFVDTEIQRNYVKYIKPHLKKYNWEPTNIDYLYTRSLYGQANTEAYRFYYSNALKRYTRYENLYTQAQLALVFNRHGDKKQARDIVRRLKEKALVSDEMGMYWRDNSGNHLWYKRPIETQALLIQAFAEVSPTDTLSIGLMQQWLLKQKQATHWGSDLATAEAIRALLAVHPVNLDTQTVGIEVFGARPDMPTYGREGYGSARWSGEGIDSLRALRNSEITISKSGDGIAWGSVMYQYTDDNGHIGTSSSGLTVSRTLLCTDTVRVGDRITVRIDFACDRAMDYIEVVDSRIACLEPVDTRAGWRSGAGMSCYVVVGNTDTRLYLEHIEKGKYRIEYDVYVTNPGRFETAPITIQSMYAPEFRALSSGEGLTVGGR